MPFPPVERIRPVTTVCAQEPRVSTPEGTAPRLMAELRLTKDRRDTTIPSGCGCILRGASTDSAESICKESIYARETTCSKRVPEKRHRLGGRPHLECCSARPRAAGSGPAADD